MEVELSAENLAFIGEISASVPDMVFTGQSRNTVFKFKQGFVYARGRITHSPEGVISHERDKYCESLVFPYNSSVLNELIHSYNVGGTIELEPHPDLDEKLALMIKQA